MMRKLLAALLILASGLALAKVPLGERVPANLRGEAKGAYWIVFYTRSCLEPALLRAHWQALRESTKDVLAVNPVEVGNVPQGAPSDFRSLGGNPALELARSLRVRTYPTTVLVDGENVIRAALEGPVTGQQVQETLNLLPRNP